VSAKAGCPWLRSAPFPDEPIGVRHMTEKRLHIAAAHARIMHVLYMGAQRHWIKLALRLITRRAKKDDQVDQHKGKSVRIVIDGKDNYQLDGDVVGQSTTLDAKIQPSALAICIPAQTAREPQQ
jgi:diacylglycerol kinase family enzyme